jgi:DNA-binding PadR family transcriptional regulator
VRDVNGVAPVILGLLRLRPMSGYDMKRFVDHSTRFFWAASYGQIYPVLRRLETAGLVSSTSAPAGGRRRTLYRLTEDGERALDEWLRSPGAGYELRDLGLLKVFFAGGLEAAELAAVVRSMRDDRARVLAQLREVDATAPHAGTRTLALRFGIDTHEFWIGWLERLERELLADEPSVEEGAA